MLAGWLVAVVLAGDPVRPGAARFGVEIGDAVGIPAGIADVAHDPDGFLWVASEEGLFRFDGTTFTRVGGRVRLQQVVAGSGGEVFAHAFGGPLHALRDGDLRPVQGPDGAVVDGVEDVTIDAAGSLWALSGSSALRLDRGDRWTAVAAPAGRSIAARKAGGVYVGTFDGRIVVLNPPQVPEVLAAELGGMVQALAEDSAGRVVANVRWGPHAGVVRLEGRRIEHLAERTGRPTSLVLRHRCVWSSWDDGVVCVCEGEPPEVLSPIHGFHGGGSLHVDHEGTLWAGGFDGGLTRFPEPDTLLWTAAVGLPHDGIRQVLSDGESRWASAWAGPLRFDAARRQWQLAPSSGVRSFDLLAGAAPSGLWTSGQVAVGGEWKGVLAILGRAGLRAASIPRSVSPWTRGALAPDGRLLLAYDRDLIEVRPGDPTPRSIGAVPDEIDAVVAMAISPAGELALAGRAGPICRRDAGTDGGWRCSASPLLDGVMTLAFADERTLWIGTDTAGLLALDESGVRPVDLDGETGRRAVVSLSLSPRGGVWIVGRVSMLRAVSDRGGARIVERVTAAHGLPRWWLSSVGEDADGTLWVAALGGIARIPGSVRDAPLPPPPVHVTRLVVAGSPRPLGTPVRTVAGREGVEVQWAALSYRDPSHIRHRFRLRPDDPWTETGTPHVAFVAPAAGRYAIELASSRDGVGWVTARAPVVLRVAPPWYGRWSVWAVAVTAGGALAYGAHRLRLAHLVRLEQQRTQIAMDLHDDLGATLGSIGLLAAVAGDEIADGATRRGAIDRIAHHARDAAGSLADIVWSLRPGSETLEGLVLALRERATELAPDGRVTIRVRADEAPGVPLALAVRRNVQWIAVEAMRNAVRHAAPAQVDVRLAKNGEGWSLTIDDDGDAGASGETRRVRGGMGIQSMRRRAEAIGGRLDVGARSPCGTCISVRFRADGRRPRTII